MSERNEELEKILDKAFSDMKKRLYRLMERTEKKIRKDLKGDLSKTKKEKHTERRHVKKSESSSSGTA
jgi:hypothetical protein